jgi:hypothetical protein
MGVVPGVIRASAHSRHFAAVVNDRLTQSAPLGTSQVCLKSLSTHPSIRGAAAEAALEARRPASKRG